MNQHLVELHPADSLSADPLAPGQLPWQEAHPADRPPCLALDGAEGFVRIAVNPQTGHLERVAASRADAVIRVVHRPLSSELVLVALRPGILVNGFPALPLTVLARKDSISLAPGCLCYVTERVRPHVGPPTGELLNRKCPFCRIAADSHTRVVTCSCGALYHWETEETHPDVADTERLRCFEKVRSCLSCGRVLTLEEYLTWDPTNL